MVAQAPWQQSLCSDSEHKGSLERVTLQLSRRIQPKEGGGNWAQGQGKPDSRVSRFIRSLVTGRLATWGAMGERGWGDVAGGEDGVQISEGLETTSRKGWSELRKM